MNRQRPAQREETTQLGTGEIGDEHRIGADVERGGSQRQQLRSPHPDFLPGVQLARHHADRPGAFARISAELEIASPNLAKRDHANPRSRLTTGWPSLSMMRSLKPSLSRSDRVLSGHTGSDNCPSASYIR